MTGPTDTADDLSIPVGDCVKIWLCFPPTPKNLVLMSKADCQKAKLLRIGKKLEGGIIFTTTSAHGIWLPAGTIHTVFTTQGGFLAAIDINTPKSSRPLAALLTANVDRLAGPNFTKLISNQFADSLDLALCNNQEATALSSWIATLDLVVEYCKITPDFHDHVFKIWTCFFKKNRYEGIVCPCGEQDDKPLNEHYILAT